MGAPPPDASTSAGEVIATPGSITTPAAPVEVTGEGVFAVEKPIAASPAARIILAVGILGYTALFAYWSLRSFNNLYMYGYDFGIHDQAAWLISRGDLNPFSTITGKYYFGDHLYWFMLLVAPIYWVWPSGGVLLIAQVSALSLAAVPAFLVARLKLRSEWLATAVAWVYLLNPYIHWTLLEQFHPDVFEVPLVFLAFLFILRRRWWMFMLSVILLLMVKEDVALLTFGLGLYVAVCHDRSMGIRVAALSALWFWANFRLLIPVLGGTGSLTEYVHQHAGRVPFGGLGGFFRTVFGRPWEVVRELFGPERPTYYLQVFGPLGFLPFLVPGLLLAVILPLAFNGLSTFPYQYSIEYHYGTLVVPALLVCSIFGIARITHKAPRMKRALVGFMLAAAIFGAYLWGPAPYSRNWVPWSVPPEGHVENVRRAVELIPDDAVVSAQYTLVTQLDHREYIYEFPHPWHEVHWDAPESAGTPLPEPATPPVDYVLALRGMEAGPDRALMAVLLSGEYEIIYNDYPVLLLERRERLTASLE